jgi:hypothetical protein
MSTKKSPLSRVKEQFGSKEHLVDALVGLPEGILERNEQDKDAFKKRLLSAANNKLLRLHHIGQSVKDRFGSKEKLVEAILTKAGHGKDADYRQKLTGLSVARLFAQASAQEKQDRRDKSQAKKA